MKGILRFLTYLVFFGIVLLAFVFAVNNTAKISLWLGVQLPEISVGVLVILAFISGNILGLLLGAFKQLKYKMQIRQLRAQLDKSNSRSEREDAFGGNRK